MFTIRHLSPEMNRETLPSPKTLFPTLMHYIVNKSICLNVYELKVQESG